MTRNKHLDWNPFGLGAGFEATDMPRQLSIAMLDYGRTLGNMQFDSAETLLTESARQFERWLGSAAEVAGGGAAPDRWPDLRYPGARGFIDIARGWLDVAAHSAVEINGLLGRALAVSFALVDERLVALPQPDRRTTAKVISFADRRRSPGAFRASAGTASMRRTASG